jgi:hypothetical protein
MEEVEDKLQLRYRMPDVTVCVGHHLHALPTRKMTLGSLLARKRALMATHKARAVCSSLVMGRSRMESSMEPKIQLRTQ